MKRRRAKRPLEPQEWLRAVEPRVARIRRLLDEVVKLRLERWQRKQESQRRVVVEEELFAQAPSPDAEKLRAGMTVEELDEELRRIDAELAKLGVERRTFLRQGHPEVGAPYRRAEYTLYARLRRLRTKEARVDYVFLQEPGWDTIPTPRPPGFRVLQPEPEKPPLLLPPVPHIPR